MSIQMVIHDWNTPEDAEGCVYTYVGQLGGLDYGPLVEDGQTVRLFDAGEDWSVDGEVVEIRAGRDEGDYQGIKVKVDWDTRKEYDRLLTEGDRGWAQL